ncbi:metallophosphoesterase family protein [Terrabacter sp. C0L_2]|uniref:metallophosphoesterase family protein n=1 Tax=Terrabacter sp. C0L_2 TaxID=3108389 RepID=UPI002ED0F51B|nr:metallophosphoesterase [Terrabacter sp. C0L_2]
MRQVGTLLARDSPWLRRGSHVLKWLAVLAACYLGGVAATNLAPTVAETSQYRAVLRLDPVPRHSPVLHAPTIVGDVDVQFASPLVAPGLDVQVAVREEITNLFTRPNVDIKALQPSADEISSAISQAAVGVGVRFALGALAIAVLLALASHYVRQRTTRRHHVLFVASAMVVATVGTFGGIALTYQPSRFAEYRTSGVLGVVQRNAGLLADVEARASQVTPYFRNLLAVTQALQQKYVAGNVNEPVSARLLLVSDIHGANQYALMKTIIAEEDIDAVIDSGDLVNFGRVQEGDAADLYRSIQSLGVPYIFTSGNHDQSSASDRALVARLGRIPNVVLLEDAAGSLRELTFHGLRITGFNDPRYFGDDNADPTAKAKPAADRYNAALADQPEPDLVVTHEPYAAEQVDRARLLVNGHMHTPAIEGNRIQVGTFTGGGVVSHYSEGPGQELDGQPYAFDIAQFGTSCELTSLTRYSFRNLLEGRPAYDSVQVISGARIDPYRPATTTAQQPGQDRPDPAKRLCSRIDETTVRTLPLAPQDPPSPGSTTAPRSTAATPPTTSTIRP